jgi:hypothetical protein
MGEILPQRGKFLLLSTGCRLCRCSKSFHFTCKNFHAGFILVARVKINDESFELKKLDFSLLSVTQQLCDQVSSKISSVKRTSKELKFQVAFQLVIYIIRNNLQVFM